ncbi:MAG: putative porin [Candidatus Parcubacteria bacterium]|nr:putative porin [Burkholderiales bacterium]
MKKALCLLAPLLAASLLAGTARADERQELEALRGATLNLIRLLVNEGVLSQEKANTLLKQAESAAAAPGERKPPVVRVPYVPEVVKEQIKEQIREEVMQQARAERWAAPNTLPAWVNGISLYGDVRFRYQYDRLDEDNAPAVFFQAAGQNINNTTEDRHRLRVRGRIGLRAKLGDTVEAGFGLATGSVGSTGSPNSTNNTLGDYLNRQAAGIDLAYVQWEPYQWLRLNGGRFQNPFFSSDLLWASDLNFDGAALGLRPRFTENFQGMFTIGAFPLKDNEPTAANPTLRNKWLYGAQAGFEYALAGGSRLKAGLALYDFQHAEGIPNTDLLNPNRSDWTAPSFRQKGNTLFPINFFGNPPLFGLASKFRIINLTGELDIASYDPVHITLLGDYARNIGFDRSEIQRRTGGLDLVPQNSAWQARLQVGHKRIEREFDWFAFGGYRRVERDSVMDAFNDGDFNLGGTNAKGWMVGGGLGVARNAWIGLKYSTANQISGAPLAIDVLQLDFNARF